MGKFILATALVVGLSGCQFFQSATSKSALTAVEQAACNEETAAIGGFASQIATTLNCSSQPAIVASLTTALGNANVCKYLPAASSGMVKTQGVIGNLICPIAVSTVVGYMTSQIPVAWGCTVTTQASAVVASLTTACETVVPVSTPAVTK